MYITLSKNFSLLFFKFSCNIFFLSSIVFLRSSKLCTNIISKFNELFLEFTSFLFRVCLLHFQILRTYIIAIHFLYNLSSLKYFLEILSLF